MASPFTLDAVREETKRKFAPFEIELGDGTAVRLSSTLRLNAEKRKVVNDSLKKVSEIAEDADDDETLELIVESISKIFYAVADKPAKLLTELADDDLTLKVALMSRVLSAWMGATEAGEA